MGLPDPRPDVSFECAGCPFSAIVAARNFLPYSVSVGMVFAFSASSTVLPSPQPQTPERSFGLKGCPSTLFSFHAVARSSLLSHRGQLCHPSGGGFDGRGVCPASFAPPFLLPPGACARAANEKPGTKAKAITTTIIRLRIVFSIRNYLLFRDLEVSFLGSL